MLCGYGRGTKKDDAPAMPIKHLRQETEIQLLADDLAARWTPAEGIMPWLRAMEAELSAKVRHQRWSWEAIARALNAAGITYETKRPWTGRSLLRKIAIIRFETRQVPQSGAQVHMPESRSLPPVTAGPEADEPEFKPATLLNWSGAKLPPSSGEAHSQPSPLPAPTRDADAIMARLMGRK